MGGLNVDARPVVYLLPGLLCDEAAWAPQIEALSSDYDVRVPLFAGFDSLTKMARSVVKDAPARFSVAGHSMGARVALEVVRLAPERVERLALLDTGVHPPGEGEAERRQVMIDLGHADMEALADRWLPPMVHPSLHDTPLMASLRAMVLRMSPEEHAGQIRALVNRSDARLMLPSIRCPVLIGVGEFDAWSPVPQHRQMARAMPQAKLVVFPGAGHMAPVESPDAVTAALKDWLAEPASAEPALASERA